MKRLSLLCVLALTLCAVAMANLIPTETSVTGPVGGPYTWTYDVALSADQQLLPSLSLPASNPVDYTDRTIAGFWTLYDFFGYVAGSCVGPTGFVCTALNTGYTPSNVSPVDNASVVNITWFYTGSTLLTGNGVDLGIDLGNFTANSIYNNPVVESYASRAFKNNGGSIGSVADNVGETEGPSGVPEPTAIALFGSVLFMAGGALRRRLR